MTVQQLCLHTKISSDFLWPDDTPVPDTTDYSSEAETSQSSRKQRSFPLHTFLSHFKSILLLIPQVAAITHFKNPTSSHRM